MCGCLGVVPLTSLNSQTLTSVDLAKLLLDGFNCIFPQNKIPWCLMMNMLNQNLLQRFNYNHRFLCKSFLKCHVFVKQAYYLAPINGSLVTVRGNLCHLKTGQIDLCAEILRLTGLMWSTKEVMFLLLPSAVNCLFEEFKSHFIILNKMDGSFFFYMHFVTIIVCNYMLILIDNAIFSQILAKGGLREEC